jgi:hypothetical protein
VSGVYLEQEYKGIPRVAHGIAAIKTVYEQAKRDWDGNGDGDKSGKSDGKN